MNNIFKVVITGTIEQLNELISTGKNVNIRDKDKRTPLIHAIIDNKIDMAKLLIQNGVDVNAQDSIGYTALHYAAQNYFVDACQLLLENKSIVDVQDEYGNTPLFRAVFNSNGRGDIIKLLLSYNADINLKNKSEISPLLLANNIGNYDVKQFFQ